eukprot:455890_1
MSVAISLNQTNKAKQIKTYHIHYWYYFTNSVSRRKKTKQFEHLFELTSIIHFSVVMQILIADYFGKTGVISIRCLVAAELTTLSMLFEFLDGVCELFFSRLILFIRTLINTAAMSYDALKKLNHMCLYVIGNILLKIHMF